MKEGSSGPLASCIRASLMTEGSWRPRRPISRKAGTKKMDWSNRASPSRSDTRPWTIWVTVTPFTRWDPTKEPALTPTYTSS